MNIDSHDIRISLDTSEVFVGRESVQMLDKIVADIVQRIDSSKRKIILDMSHVRLFTSFYMSIMLKLMNKIEKWGMCSELVIEITEDATMLEYVKGALRDFANGKFTFLLSTVVVKG